VRVLWLILLGGCGGPFVEARPGSATVQATGVSVAFCGSTKMTTERVLKAMEPPSSVPSDVGGSGGLEPPEEAQFCLRLENRGSQTVRVDRRALTLSCPREKQPWVPDGSDREVIVHSGESKQLRISFHYSPLPSGEDVAVVLDGAVSAGGRPLKLPSLPLRRR
jgi:hypothetical protein